MAGQSVVIVGTMTDSEGKTQQVTIQGVGAIAPVDPGYGVPLPPLGIWGPTDPRPSHPIVLPEPPEVPTEPPIAPPGGGVSEGWQWYYSPVYGWILVWVPPEGGGKPRPPGGSAPPPTAQPKG